MNPTAQCSCMVPHCSPADPNLFNNNIRLETDSDNDNIFRSLSDIQSIPFLQQQGSPTTCQFTPLLLCHEESSASSKTKSTETRLIFQDISRGIPGALKTNKLGQNHRRTRSATYERRRRNRIREKLKALGELIPHSHKQDTASLLEAAIDYLKALKLKLK
ncbi:transcription factor LRL2-like isoform X6 [Ricinus communis]|uniref:transcription factor LRL2-like isoform X6 n=1 Tax=Ricinus communis TaxID=3988 RepID=UPI00201A82ED|nr:transcription factor LRL2-like isoform X6 [Ricinus communis]